MPRKIFLDQYAMDFHSRIPNCMVMPQRVLLSIFGFLAIVNVYTMRYCLDIALNQIVSSGNQNLSKVSNLTAPSLTGIKFYRNATHHFFKRLNVTSFSINLYNETRQCEQLKSGANKGTYDWSDELQTVILTSFYVGYVLSHIPGGLLAERYGGKWVLAIAILITAILTLLTPITIQYGGPIALILLRILIGLSEGPAFPALSCLLSHWIPAKERGKLGVLALSGGQVGIILVNILSDLLTRIFHWPLLFYFFGGCALIWFVLFALFCFNDPESNPYIKESEKQYLNQEIYQIKKKINHQLPPTPWKDILQSPPMWAAISSTLQYDWTQANLVNNVTSVLRQAHDANSSLKENLYSSVTVSIPYIINWIVSLLSGALSDLLISCNMVSTTDMRRLMTTVAALASNFLTSFTTCLTCTGNHSIFDIFGCTLGVMGAYYAGSKLAPLDLSPNYSGTLMAIANGVGSLGSGIAPFMENYLSNNGILKELRAIIWIACTVIMSGEVQHYNDPIELNENNL